MKINFFPALLLFVNADEDDLLPTLPGIIEKSVLATLKEKRDPDAVVSHPSDFSNGTADVTSLETHPKSDYCALKGGINYCPCQGEIYQCSATKNDIRSCWSSSEELCKEGFNGFTDASWCPALCTEGTVLDDYCCYSDKVLVEKSDSSTIMLTLSNDHPSTSSVYIHDISLPKRAALQTGMSFSIPSDQPSTEQAVMSSTIPSNQLSVEPTITVIPSYQPLTVIPSYRPSSLSTVTPPVILSAEPSIMSSIISSDQPTVVSSTIPSQHPSAVSTISELPTIIRSDVPSDQLTLEPSVISSAIPSDQLSAEPSQKEPSYQPFQQPINQPCENGIGEIPTFFYNGNDYKYFPCRWVKTLNETERDKICKIKEVMSYCKEMCNSCIYSPSSNHPSITLSSTFLPLQPSISYSYSYSYSYSFSSTLTPTFIPSGKTSSFK